MLAAQALINSAKKIVIISHKGPDGDTIGANLALRHALKYQLHKQVVSVCADRPPTNVHFLPEVSQFVPDFDLKWADLVIAVDCGAAYMMKFNETKPQILSGNPPLLNIDHHASNEHFGKVNLVDSTCAAACQIIYKFLNFCSLKIDRKIATCLLNGLYFDTGSFMHSNTTPEVLEIASSLLWKGADFKTIARNQFHTMSIPQLKIYGKILERARLKTKNSMVVSALTSADCKATGSSSHDASGVIDYLNSIPESDFCCLLCEDNKGLLKGSFRSRADSIDLSRLAGLFGGGGHKKAAGFSMPGRLMEMEGKPIRVCPNRSTPAPPAK